MERQLRRRDFMKLTAAGCAACLAPGRLFAAPPAPEGLAPGLLSPGCRKSKVRIAKIYMGIPKAMWPTPLMDLNAEVQRYEAEFAKMRKEFADVEFVVNELVTQRDQVEKLAAKAKDADGVLAIHLSMGVLDGILRPILAFKKPTLLFAAPYSGHEWASFGAVRKTPEGALLECILSSDLKDLAVAVRPFRAIHHLRDAKIVNVSAREPGAEYRKSLAEKFGTEIKTIGRDRVLEAFNAIDPAAAEAETERWVKGAVKVVEPPRDEVFRSCRQALAFEKILEAEQATVLTVDCYGSMYRQIPAFPCVGFVRLNNLGLGGICESDIPSAMTHILCQGLVGRPAFISDPTMDESKKGIILAHCLGTLKMDGPEGEAAPYKLRTIMERQEGCVPQAFLRVGQKVTQLEIIGTEKIIYFTGDIIEAPDVDRGCRTKILVKVDGDPEKLWQNWSHGLHRQTVYGDIAADLKRYCRYKGIQLVNEAV